MEWSNDQKAVLSSKGNVLVSASAGSGKTTVLIEKIIRMLEEGADVRRILVMTFTRAAAQDMKNKLVEKMYKRLSFGKESDRIRKQLEYVPFADVCTINSFCFSLMKKYFSAVNVDPSCSILDEDEENKLWDECMDRVLERKIGEGRPDFLKALEYFSRRRKTDGIKEAVAALRTFLNSQEDPEIFLKNADDGFLKAEEFYLSRVRRRAARLAERCKEVLEVREQEGFSDKNEELFKDILLRLTRAGTADIKGYFGEIEGLPPMRAYSGAIVEKGKATSYLKELMNRVITGAKEIKKEAEQARELFFADKSPAFITDVLVKLYRENEKEYAARKKIRSAVDFTDAERAALAILRQDALREEISKKYDCIFIDEYQDTNYLQEALLEGIGRGDNLFAVGDVKQAIYLFRYAEPKIFNDRKNFYEATNRGTNRTLNDNFRSCDAVLDFTNEVFSEIMTSDFGGVNYRREALLRGGLHEKGAENAVRVYTYPKENDDEEAECGKIYRVKTAPKLKKRDREAEFIASEAERMVREGKRKYKDIAVLVRTNDMVSSIADALKERNVPYYVAKEKKDVFAERETLIDCLRILLNDENDIPLVNVLIGVFGFGSEELMKIRLFSPDVSYSEAVRRYDGEKELVEKRNAFAERMERWRFCAEYMSVADLMREIVKSGYDAVLMKNGRIARINAFILFAEKQAGSMSVGEFVEYYDEIYDGNTPPAPPSAVTLITSHGSKGLEFPVVFMPYISRQSGGKIGGKQILCDRELGVAVNRFDEEGRSTQKTFPLYVMEMKKAEEEKEGELRLMYVAFTRAREELILIGEEKAFEKESEEATCVMDWLTYTRRKNGAFDRYFFPLPPAHGQKSEKTEIVPKKLDFSVLEKTYAYTEGTTTYAKTSVSGILQREERDPAIRVVRRDGDDIDIRRGTAMHAVLRYIDFSVRTTEEVRFEVERLLKEGLIAEEEAALVDHEKICGVVCSPDMAALRSCVCHREYPFIAYAYPYDGAADKILIQGVIDLLVELPDGTFMLVDYKMSRLGAQKLKERYSEQIYLYKRAVEEILKKPVSRAFLYNLNSGETVCF